MGNIFEELAKEGDSFEISRPCLSVVFTASELESAIDFLLELSHFALEYNLYEKIIKTRLSL